MMFTVIGYVTWANEGAYLFPLSATPNGAVNNWAAACREAGVPEGVIDEGLRLKVEGVDKPVEILGGDERLIIREIDVISLASEFIRQSFENAAANIREANMNKTL